MTYADLHLHRRIRFPSHLLVTVALASLAAACDIGSASEDLAAASPDASMVRAAEVADGSTDAVTIVASRIDTGVTDVDQDGVGDEANYGERNRALSVGEQGGDGRNLRYVAPFEGLAAARESVAAGAESTLSFTVWRADELDGRQLVVTALAGGRRGIADFDRDGVEVYRGPATVGRMTIDVTQALEATSDTTVTFRFATDVAPGKSDGNVSQINIATADARSGRRPTLDVAAAPAPAEPAPAEPAPAEPAPAEPAPAQPAPAEPPPAQPAPAPNQPPANAPSGMSVVWTDEFNGSTLNTRVWKPYHSTYGDGNREDQCHTPDNVVVSGGTLKITARSGKVTCPNGSVREYSSGFLGTRETGTYFPRYGRFEIRAKLPHGQGLWPAFWLRHRQGSSTAEVDVMEYFHSQVPGQTTSTLHLDGRDNVSKRTVSFEKPTSNPAWHTWAVDIENARDGVKFTFMLDGKAFHTYTDTQRRWAGAAPAEDLWDIAVNLSVGGNWVGDADSRLGYLPDLGICAQGGSPPNRCDATDIRRASFPATYEVDYVRVYRRN